MDSNKGRLLQLVLALFVDLWGLLANGCSFWEPPRDNVFVFTLLLCLSLTSCCLWVFSMIFCCLTPAVVSEPAGNEDSAATLLNILYRSLSCLAERDCLICLVCVRGQKCEKKISWHWKVDIKYSFISFNSLQSLLPYSALLGAEYLEPGGKKNKIKFQQRKSYVWW